MRGAEMKLTLRALSALLGYPSAELQAHTGEVCDTLRDEGVLPSAAIKGLEPLLSRIESSELLDLQAEYSEFFDRSRSLSLHLFEHIHGDSRERGQAMIDLVEQYVEAGFYLDSTELPDFVPVFLEFARSEEHTSELQSLMRISYAVFCLKNKKKSQQH